MSQSRFLNAGARWPTHLTLVVLTFVWILPTLGVTVTSLRNPNDVAASGWWTVLGNPSVSLDNYACWGAAVNHLRKRMASALFGEASFTMKDEPAPPHIRMGCFVVTRGGGIAANERPGFIPL